MSNNLTKAIAVARQRITLAPANSRERFVRLLTLAALELAQSANPALSPSARMRWGATSHTGPGGESLGLPPGGPVRVPAHRAIKSIPR
jgi:hypothetical protein